MRYHFSSRRFRRAAAVAGLLATLTTGCNSESKTDRASYEDERPSSRSASAERSHPVAKPQARETARNADGRRPPAPTVLDQSTTPVAVIGRPEPRPIDTPVPSRGLAASSHDLAASSHTAAAIETTTPATAPTADSVSTAATETPSSLNPASMNPASHDADAALRQAEEFCRLGTAGAAKGAWFTAKSEFHEALRLAAVAADARTGGTQRSAALVAALNALDESEDLSPRSAATARTADLELVLRSHRTSAWIEPPQAGATAAALHEAYLTFAEKHFAAAVEGTQAGSIALHGLGKIHAAAGSTISNGRAKARCFYSAAIAVAPENFLAANDLAVLLAEEGRLEQARDLLHAGLRQSSQPAMWNNLASVHDRLGETQMAQRARLEATEVERRGVAAPGAVLPTHHVAWLDPRGFAATSRPSTDARFVAPPAAGGGVAGPAAGQPASQSVGGWAQRPVSRVLAY